MLFPILDGASSLCSDEIHVAFITVLVAKVGY